MDFYNDISRYNDKIALITDKNIKMTYKQLVDDADNIMKGLQERSILFLVCKNCVETICAYVGALRNKIVPVMINSEMDAELFDNLCEIYNPSYIYAPENWNDIEKYGVTKVSEYREFNMYDANKKKDYEVNERLALLLTTSGSTGSPKLVRQSYDNIKSNALAIANYM